MLDTPTRVFSSEYCKIFKNTYFEEHLRTAASVTKALIVLLLSFVLIHKLGHIKNKGVRQSHASSRSLEAIDV